AGRATRGAGRGDAWEHEGLPGQPERKRGRSEWAPARGKSGGEETAGGQRQARDAHAPNLSPAGECAQAERGESRGPLTRSVARERHADAGPSRRGSLPP